MEVQMLTIRRAADRFHTRIGWLDSWHTFSFGEHYHPQHEGFRNLRVINDDTVAPGMGFGTHGHRDMEIISYVVSGALGHRDSMGTGSIIRPGDIQRMSAGRGVLHSEMNPDAQTPVHFLQIWIIPSALGVDPSYEQKSFADEARRDTLRLVAAPAGADGAGEAIGLHADARLYAGLLGEGARAELALAPGRHAWVHLVEGGAQLRAGQGAAELRTGDGAGISEEQALSLVGVGPRTEVLVFDLP
jgi:quercetin 2,3-dioxygenase